MKSRIVAVALCSLFILTLGTGCESARKRTKLDRNKTGMFSNDRQVLKEKFEGIVRGKTTLTDLEWAGFDLKSRNVQKFTGVPAFRELFGPDVFRNAIDGNVGFDKRLPEFNSYTLYQIPYKDLTVTSDRIYMNKKVTTTVGWDSLYSIVLHNDIVIYAAPREVFMDQLQTDRRIFGGPIDLLQEIGGMLGFLK
ncbi:MAG: hypothetical protein RLZZ347_71 [Candidatus Parcubacteria bacterium]|jgi:hypothetical protein